ncbi:hypothetical protein OG500_19230 [Kitasatospora sp. NBC_01250]|uniref:hypothetical protein n=1 Tax=Kitasatospora sp. NBC_01250 TaxID=2903571 RepID=UPI002E335583|nr:hypothetical protein [Kitasatospora sp. NBC_01250]
MTHEISLVVQATVHAGPWMLITYLLIRRLSPVMLAFTHVVITGVALFHRTSQRRREARQILERHPFSQRQFGLQDHSAMPPR